MSPAPGSDREPSDLAGRTFGRFEILARLGAGGMGVVYRALDTRLKREVAVKFLPRALADDPMFVTRFEREAEAVAALNHPNVVTIHSVEHVDAHHFIVMELVEGRGLDRVIPERGLSRERFLEVAIALSSALAAAHARGIVHRDLKPGNVMETRSGEIKVLDFGLAKLFQPPGDDDETLLAEDLTREGSMVGTPAYMSPEQVKGGPIDHRTDIFSLGIIFYEMVTGRRPFAGGSPAEVVSSVLRDRPASASAIRDSLPRSLGRIIDHCLEKDPDLRFQSAKELHHQLSSLRDEFASEEILQTAELGARDRPGPWRRAAQQLLARPWRWAGVATLAIAVGAALYLAPAGRRSPDGSPARPGAETAAGRPVVVAGEQRPSLVLLPFRNLTDDPELAWLEGGLPEMLFTSLSQAPGFQVLPTDRGYELLKQLGPGEREAFENLLERAAEAGISRTLTGSFARLDGAFQLTVEIRDAATGRILLTERSEGAGQSRVFSMVDDLSRAILQQLEGSRDQVLEPSAEIMEVTTTSLPAYRYYTEAIRLRRETKREEALSLLERAVELDPGFAMALSNISTAYLNMGDEERAREFARRAFENSARAPARERYYIQGMYLGLEWVTCVEAIGALQRAVDAYPDHDAARRNLAFYLGRLERYDEAIPHYQILVAKRPLFGGNYWLLTESYDALDRFEEGQTVARDYLRRSSGNWYGYLLQGWHLLRWGRVGEAVTNFDLAESARPGTLEVVQSRWAADIQSERWREAEVAAQSLASSSDPYYRWLGHAYVERTALYRGRLEPALAAIRQGAAGFAKPGALPGTAHAWHADLLLLLEDDEAALDAATLAQRTGRGQWPQLHGQFLAAVALERLGRSAEADGLAADLQRRVDALPNNPERRQALHLAGLLALSRGNLEDAIDKLTRAVALLPARGFAGTHRIPDHAPLWYSLAQALARAGRDQEAASWYESVVDNRVESREFPVRWARSLYELGVLYEKLGDPERARASYRRFAALWADGDLDRERVALAREQS